MTYLSLLSKEAVANTQFFGSIKNNVLFHAPTFFHCPLPIITIVLSAVVIPFAYPNTKFISTWLLACWAMAVIFQSPAQARHWIAVKSAFYHKDTMVKQQRIWGEGVNLMACTKDKLRTKRLSGTFNPKLEPTDLAYAIFQYDLYPMVDLITPSTRPQVRVCWAGQECWQAPPEAICSMNNGYISMINATKRE